ncbi:hypothetical protein [Haladaptatus sp. NG-SE-30]
MSNSNARNPLRPKRPLVVGLVLVTAIVTMMLFVPTMQGHIATMNIGSVDVTATEYAVTDGGEHLSATFEVHNPTRRTVVFYSGLLHAYDGQTQLNDGTTTMFDKTAVPAGETVEITANIDLTPATEKQTRRAVQSGSIRLAGEINGEIGQKSVTVPVDIGGAN